MTGRAIDRVLERIRQSQTQLALQIAAERATRPAAAADAGAGHAIGARVFDPLSGEEGVVIGGARENVVVPTAK